MSIKNFILAMLPIMVLTTDQVFASTGGIDEEHMNIHSLVDAQPSMKETYTTKNLKNESYNNPFKIALEPTSESDYHQFNISQELIAASESDNCTPNMALKPIVASDYNNYSFNTFQKSTITSESEGEKSITQYQYHSLTSK